MEYIIIHKYTGDHIAGEQDTIDIEYYETLNEALAEITPGDVIAKVINKEIKING
jgi:hypothetical protein